MHGFFLHIPPDKRWIFASLFKYSLKFTTPNPSVFISQTNISGIQSNEELSTLEVGGTLMNIPLSLTLFHFKQRNIVNSMKHWPYQDRRLFSYPGIMRESILIFFYFALFSELGISFLSSSISLNLLEEVMPRVVAKANF